MTVHNFSQVLIDNLILYLMKTISIDYCDYIPNWVAAVCMLMFTCEDSASLKYPTAALCYLTSCCDSR